MLHNPLKDTLDRVITIGDKVVYNRSGYLEFGQVAKIIPSNRRSKCYWPFTFHINHHKTGETSKVKDSRCIMVVNYVNINNP